MNPIHFPRHRAPYWNAPLTSLGPSDYQGKHAAWETIQNPTPAQLEEFFASPDEAS